MAGASLKIVLVVIGVVAAFIIASAGSAGAASLKQCHDAYNSCMDRCDKLPPGGDGSKLAICKGKCGNRLDKCSGWSLPPKKGTKLLNTINESGDKQLTPKGKKVLDTVNEGGDKQLGTGITPKGKGVLDTVNVGGVSGPPSGRRFGAGAKKK
jgi:hypothetical protein